MRNKTSGLLWDLCVTSVGDNILSFDDFGSEPVDTKRVGTFKNKPNIVISDRKPDYRSQGGGPNKMAEIIL